MSLDERTSPDSPLRANAVGDTRPTDAAAQENVAVEPDPLTELRAAFAGLSASIYDFIQVRVDGAKLSLRRAIAQLVTAIALVIALALVMLLGLILFLIGAAQGVAAALGAPPWLGYLLVGAAAIAIPATIQFVQQRAAQKRRIERARIEYETRANRRAA